MILPDEKIEEGIYSKKSRDKLVKDGEITNEEAGFMEGYESDEIDEVRED